MALLAIFTVLLVACTQAQPAVDSSPTSTLAPTSTALTPVQSPTTVSTQMPTVTDSPIALTTKSPEPTNTPVTKVTSQPKPTDVPDPTMTPTPSKLEQMWNQRVEQAFASSDCPTATERELEESDYRGPLIDTHFHMSHLWDAPLGADADGGSYERDLLAGDFPTDLPVLGKNITMTQIACRFEREGTDSVFAFFFVESGRPGQLRPSLEVVRRTMETYPSQFVPFIMTPCCDELSPTVDADTLSEFLNIYPGLFQGYGEIPLYDFVGARQAEEYPPDGPIVLGAYKVARKHKLVVYLHPGEGHQESLERVLEQHSDINFIVHGEETEGNIGNLMGKHSNIYYSINELHARKYLLRGGGNKSRFLETLTDYETLIEQDLATWQKLIEAYPDRFMWATDRGNTAGLWTYDADVGQLLVDYARAFIGRLDPSVQEKFAYMNVQELLQD